jgi:hypothetical protein
MVLQSTPGSSLPAAAIIIKPGVGAGDTRPTLFFRWAGQIRQIGRGLLIPSCVQKGNLSLVGADLCVRPGLKAHTQVRPYRIEAFLTSMGATWYQLVRIWIIGADIPGCCDLRRIASFGVEPPAHYPPAGFSLTRREKSVIRDKDNTRAVFRRSPRNAQLCRIFTARGYHRCSGEPGS